MSSPATNACMIGDRYLASAAAVASSPSGPVDALDTRSGRAAQVRVLFTGPRLGRGGTRRRGVALVLAGRV